MMGGLLMNWREMTTIDRAGPVLAEEVRATFADFGCGTSAQCRASPAAIPREGAAAGCLRRHMAYR